MPGPVNKQLLIRYLEHNCSQSEQEAVEAFLQTPESKALFEQVMDEYWFSVGHEDETGEDINYYQKFKNRYDLPANGRHAPRRVNMQRYLSYAALLLISITAGLVFLRQDRSEHPALTYIHKYNLRGQRSIITLPDSSLVYLGPDSRLSFCENLQGTKREITLEGEAFFDIRHDAKRPFVVHTDSIETVVLGTSFKVEAFKRSKINVAVATGKVGVGRLSSSGGYRPLAVLLPGQEVVYKLSDSSVCLKRIFAADLLSWRRGNLIFRDMKLADIVEKLERWYNVQIIVQKDVADVRLSASFGRENINEVLEIISRTAGLQYRVINSKYYFNKPNMKKS